MYRNAHVVKTVRISLGGVTRIRTTPTPTPTLKDSILALPMGSIVWEIYGHESTWGQHDGCITGYNGFGYGWDGSHYPCYDSLQEVAQHVSNWLIDNAYMGTKGELCYYNKGIKGMTDCEYAEYTLSL